MSPTFTITASPGTDVWRKPPSTDIFNAPTASPPSTQVTGSLSTFLSARVSFLLPDPSQLRQYDQAGLLVSFGDGTSSSATATSSPSPPKWIKLGVENYNGTPRAATVACDAWADWSLAPVTVPSSAAAAAAADGNWVTVMISRGSDELGLSLWVYQVVPGKAGSGQEEEKIPLREICWPFGGSSDDGKEGEEAGLDHVTVQAYACRPNKESGELEAKFKGFEVAWK